MNKVIVDDEFRAKLNGFNEDIELCDESGETLAYVLSPEDYNRLVLAWLKTQVSDQEVQRIRDAAPGERRRKLSDIWKDLGAL